MKTVFFLLFSASLAYAPVLAIEISLGGDSMYFCGCFQNPRELFVITGVIINSFRIETSRMVGEEILDPSQYSVLKTEAGVGILFPPSTSNPYYWLIINISFPGKGMFPLKIISVDQEGMVNVVVESFYNVSSGYGRGFIMAPKKGGDSRPTRVSTWGALKR